MRDLGRVVGHIPARGGSKRVKSKNLRYIAGRPLLSYSIEVARLANRIDEVVVNTDSDEIASLGEACGAKIFRRDQELASDSASGDAFTYDFLKKYEVDTLVMISPVCPLVEVSDVDGALEAFTQDQESDTLITCCSTRMQTFKGDEPVNISLDGPLAPSQDNDLVHTLNWAVTIWNAKAYLENYERDGYAYIGVHRTLFPIAMTHGVKISVESDFATAEALLKARGITGGTDDAKYWNIDSVVDWK